MSTLARSIDGRRVTVRLAMKMEDSLQAFAVRAVCFMAGLGVPFSEEFDGHDYGATHVIACLGEEPIGTVRVRWFKSFALIERLAVLPRFRGHRVGQLLLERCRILAHGRDCNALYAQILPCDSGYWERLGWRRLEAKSTADPRQIIAVAKAVDSSRLAPQVDGPELVVLRREPNFSTADIPLGACWN
jgi:GNAT superfamily N-acetyltransferase